MSRPRVGRKAAATLQGKPGRIALVVGAVLLLAVLAMLRETGQAAWRTVWAEDGLFISEVYRHGFATLFYRYADYLQTLPRLISLVSAMAPVERIPLFNALTGSLILGGLAVLAFRWSEDLVSSVLLRCVLAVAMVVHPLTITENLANIINLSWPLLFVGFLALVHRPRTRGETVAQSIVVVLSVLSQAVAILFLPIAAWLFAKVQDGRRAAAIGLAAGAIVQAGVILAKSPQTASPLPHAANPNGLLEVVPLWVVHVLGTGWFGEKWLSDLWLHEGPWPTALLAGVGTITVFAIFAAGAARRNRPVAPAFGLLALSFTLYALAILTRGVPTLQAGSYSSAGARYAYVALLLMVTGLFSLVDAQRIQVRRIAVLAIVLQLVIVAGFAFRMANGRSAQTSWVLKIAQARQTCRRDPTATVTVPVAPALPWALRVPCTRL